MDPDQLDCFLAIVTDRSDSTFQSSDDQEVADSVHKVLNSPLGNHSAFPGLLQDKLRYFTAAISDKSLMDMVLNSETEPVILKAIGYCAREYSFHVSTQAENAIAITIYYAVTASLLVHHHRKIADHSYKDFIESFADLMNKRWLEHKLRRLLDRACKICRQKQDRKETDRKRLSDEESLRSGHLHTRTDSASDSVSSSSGILVYGVGDWVGQYKLLDILGEGGMGIAYLAEQEQPIKRQVALKVIKPGMDSQRVIARFEAERQALALLDHPNIAHIYDAGTALTGRPYFVMEYVKGLPVTEHCDRYKLTIEMRLRLFQQVCGAVQHAHQKGLIHRDIKPSNILVSIQDDKATPKIIDFGVAKALSMPLTERTLATEESQLLGTPEYMSPEQADMAAEDIDTRSDIYSLGVLLYVLLTGALPFDSDTLRTGGIERIRQIIRETDPKTPSTRLTKLGEEAKKVAESRRTEVGALAKRLHRELEWIPLKAMRKERVERYRSASELADDIDNYLNGAPLIAGPPTAGYRLRKSLRRHKALVGGAAAVLVVSVIGTIVSFAFALGQSRAHAESEAVTRFLLTDVLGAVNQFKGNETTTVDVFNSAMAELLDICSKELEVKFKDQPVVEAKICWQLGILYSEVDDFQTAAAQMARSYQLNRELGARTRNSKRILAQLSLAAGQTSEAERLFKELIETTKASQWECNLALVYLEQGRYEEAERLWVRHLWTDTPWWKPWYPKGIPYIEDLAIVYFYQGRYEKAAKLFDQFIEEQGEDAFGQDELARLGYVYMAQGRYNEAADLFRRGLEYCSRKFLGKGHRLTFAYANGLAVLHTKQKHYEDAECLFQEMLAVPRRWGQDHPLLLETINAFGVLRREQAKYEEASKLLNTAFEGRKTKLGPDHPATLESIHELAVLYKKQERCAEAEKYLIKAIEGRRLKLGDTHPHTIESLNNLIELYEAWNKPEEADKWRAKLQSSDSQSVNQ